jgi:hypothetical protein
MNKEIRSNDLMYKVMELAATYNYSEMVDMVKTVEQYQKEGKFSINEVKAITREDEITILSNKLYEHDKYPELVKILAIKTAYNTTDDVYLKYFETKTNDEIIEYISCLSAVAGIDDEIESEIYNIVLDTLGFEKCIDIIENADIYIHEWLKVEFNLEDIKETLYKSYAKI